MDRLEVILDLNKNYIGLASKKVELSPPFFVNVSKTSKEETWLRIQYHPEKKKGNLDYSRLKAEEKKLFDGISKMFEGTPIWFNNSHEGTGGILPETTLVLPREYYKVIISD